MILSPSVSRILYFPLCCFLSCNFLIGDGSWNLQWRIDSSWFKRIDCSSHVSFILIIPQWKNLNKYQRKPTALDIYINNWGEYSPSYLPRTSSNFSKWIFARKTRRYIPRETPARSPSMSPAFNLSNLSAENIRSLWWPRYLSSQILPLANDLVTPKICLLQILLSNVERILLLVM